MHPWNEELYLFTPDEFNQLPDGTVLTSIDGETSIKGIDDIDMDTRFGHIAYGVTNPNNHPLSELFCKFMIMK